MAEQLRRDVPGGIGTYAAGLVSGLVAWGGAELTLHASRAPARPDPLAAFGLPVRTSAWPAHGLTRAWDLGLVRAPLGWDVVHSVSLAFPGPPRRRAGGRVRIGLTVHDLAWRLVPDAFTPRGRRWHEAALRRALGQADLIICPGAPTGDLLRDAGARRVEVIEEGSDHLPAPDHAAAREALARAGVEGPYLLCVGTLEPRKNLARLAEAFARARPRLPEPWPLVVVGPPGWGPSLPPHPGVVVLGRTSEPVLAGLYAGARCLAYVPLLEGFGLPALEAMVYGTPVVASPMPSTGPAAIEVDPTDIESITAGLLEGALDGPARSRAQELGRQRAASLTWAAAARRHLEAWAGLG